MARRIVAIDDAPVRAKRAIRYFIGGAWLVGWTGPVERRDPASYQRRSVHETWACRSCRNWTTDGAHLVGRCNWCGEGRA